MAVAVEIIEIANAGVAALDDQADPSYYCPGSFYDSLRRTWEAESRQSAQNTLDSMRSNGYPSYKGPDTYAILLTATRRVNCLT